MNEWIAQKIQQVISSDQTGNKPVPCRFVQGTCHRLTCGVMYRSSHALGCSLPLPPVLQKFRAREVILRLKSCESLNHCHFSRAESDSTLAVPYTGSGVSSCMLPQAIYNTFRAINSPSNLLTFWLMKLTSCRSVKNEGSFFFSAPTLQRRWAVHLVSYSYLQQDREIWNPDCACYALENKCNWWKNTSFWWNASQGTKDLLCSVCSTSRKSPWMQGKLLTLGLMMKIFPFGIPTLR